jgi:hypothetical protein
MSTRDPKEQQRYESEENNFGDEEYDDMEFLEHLESLREDMENLGVSTLAEVIQRIKELHQKLDKRA